MSCCPLLVTVLTKLSDANYQKSLQERRLRAASKALVVLESAFVNIFLSSVIDYHQILTFRKMSKSNLHQKFPDRLYVCILNTAAAC